jgi:cobalt-zinc-cadmium efflux system membrane fusion protein
MLGFNMKNQKLNPFLAASSVGVSLLFTGLFFLAGLGFSAQAGQGHAHDETPKASVNAQPLAANTSGEKQEAEAHGGEKHGDEALKLTQVQRNLAGIEVSELQAQHFSLASFATATLLVDRDKTASLGAQLEVKILARHVVPGRLH